MVESSFSLLLASTISSPTWTKWAVILRGVSLLTYSADGQHHPKRLNLLRGERRIFLGLKALIAEIKYLKPESDWVWAQFLRQWFKICRWRQVTMLEKCSSIFNFQLNDLLAHLSWPLLLRRGFVYLHKQTVVLETGWAFASQIIKFEEEPETNHKVIYWFTLWPSQDKFFGIKE